MLIFSSCKAKRLDSDMGSKFNLYKPLNKTQLPIKLLFLYILQALCSKTNLNSNETRWAIEIKFLKMWVHKMCCQGLNKNLILKTI